MQIQEALESYYRQSRPQYEDVKISQLTRVEGGMECEIYAFRVSFIEGDARQALDRILRIYHLPRRDLGWLSERHRREYLGLRWLRKHGYPVPTAQELVEAPHYLGRPFLIMERLPGQPAGDVYQRATCWERKNLLRDFTQLYADLHALPWQEFFDGRMRTIEEEIREWAGLARIFAADGFDAGWTWLLDHRPPETSPAVVHGDYHLENVLVAPGGELSVIDWTLVRVTDYRFDLGWTLVLAGSAQLRKRLLEGYGEARGMTVPDIAYFEAASALKRLLTFAMILESGAETVGLRPGTDEKIIRAMAGHVQHLYNRWSAITGCELAGIAGHLRGTGIR